MAGQPKITEKQIAAFANNDKPASGVPRRRSLVSAKARAAAGNPGSCFTAGIKRPQADKLLENTLVNNIGTSVPITKREAQILPINSRWKDQQANSPNAFLKPPNY
jgi:hypothetical protein